MQSFSHLLMASIFLIIILQCAESVIVFLEFYFPGSYMIPETQNLHLSMSIGNMPEGTCDPISLMSQKFIFL